MNYIHKNNNREKYNVIMVCILLILILFVFYYYFYYLCNNRADRCIYKTCLFNCECMRY